MSRKSPSISSTASLTARKRVRAELKKVSHTEVPFSDVQKLRDQIIPPNTPLDKQKEIVTKESEKHESKLGFHYNSYDKFQDTIQGLETKLSRLQEESDRAQQELKERRERLKEGLLELLRYQKLIDQIDKEIADKTSKFEAKLDEIENRREQILNDPNLTEEEKRELLAKLDEELEDLKRKHGSAMALLENEKKPLKRAMKEIEQSMIDEQNNRKYFFDEKGRYYLNDDGVKIYESEEEERRRKAAALKKSEEMRAAASKVESKGSKDIPLETKEAKRRSEKLYQGIIELNSLDKGITQIDKRISEVPKESKKTLQKEQESMKDQARLEAEIIQVTINEMKKENKEPQEEIAKLNTGIPPVKTLELVEKYSNTQKFFFDDKGRFYLDENGQRVYPDQPKTPPGPDKPCDSPCDKPRKKPCDTPCDKSRDTPCDKPRNKSCVQNSGDFKQYREELRCGLLKLLQLQKCIDTIDTKICCKCEPSVPSKGKCMKKEKCSRMTNAETCTLINELDQQLCELKKVHTNALRIKQQVRDLYKEKIGNTGQKCNAKAKQTKCHDFKEPNPQLICLQKKKEDLKKEARFRAKKLDQTLKCFERCNIDVYEELKKLKLGVCPTNVLKLLEKNATSKKYCFDCKGRFYVDKCGNKIYEDESCSGSIQNSGLDMACCNYSEESDVSCDLCPLTCDDLRRLKDVEYLKRTVGPALRLGLAKVTLCKPIDPISYLANFLIQYRCNQMRNEQQQIEFEDICKLRGKVNRPCKSAEDVSANCSDYSEL